MTTNSNTSKQEVLAIEDGMMLDYLTNNPIKETPKELVRQKTLRALFHEYGNSAEDMALDFSTTVGGKKKKIAMSIFEHGAEHLPKNVRRIVICDKEPKKGKKSAIKLRDHDQAQKDLQLMEDMMGETGLSLTTVTLLHKETALKVDSEALDKLCDFFDCEIQELLLQKSPAETEFNGD